MYIKKRHGANGKADSTMADVNDIASFPMFWRIITAWNWLAIKRKQPQ